MMKLALIVALLFLLIGCGQQAGETYNIPEARDTAITPGNAFSERFFDSLELERYIDTAAMPDTLAFLLRDFYNVRNYQYAWSGDSGLNEQALNFWNMQANFIAYQRDSSIYNPFLQSIVDSFTTNGARGTIAGNVHLNAEIGFTRQFFRYAARAYLGRRDIEPKDVKWFIPRRRVNILAMLDSFVHSRDRKIEHYEPLNRQYALLRGFLQKYSSIQAEGGWQLIETENPVLKQGDSLPSVRQIKKRLALTDDFTVADTSMMFTDSLASAVSRFQARMGLAEDGAVGPATLAQLNKPLKERVRQLLVNMERIKWLPAEPEGDYLLVNIPEYRLHVYEKGQYAYNMKVVVGSTQHRTVIFTGLLKHVVFSPYWNIPPGILKNEVLPGIRRDPSYLARHNMEWNNGMVRQKPGRNNSLGLVKFLFPNSYNIYLHDTPAKSLFGETSRAFSHGCIRVAEPLKLAEWILRHDSTWTTEKMLSFMQSGKERYVEVDKDIPVFIGYFTSWVDRQGRLNFRNDVYGHDNAMSEKMFSE